MGSRWTKVGACALGLIVAALAGCEDYVVETAEPPALAAEPVVGGKEVTTCQWPSTVAVNGCTGTLIHPRVVTTAAHCLNGTSAQVIFGGYRGSAAGAFTLQGTCRTGARGSSGGGSNRDWGYCVIPEDDRVKAMPYTPPLVGCEAERFLKAGAKGWVVGYGTTGPDGRGGGIKREVEVMVNRVSNGTVNVGDKDRGACHGDSGGPIYMHLTDGAKDYGWRVFGSTSSAGEARCDCTCSTLYVDISMHVDAIEANEDIDVTPCTDADGKWAPGPECNNLIKAPQMAGGTFPSCTVEKTAEPIDSCGMGPTTGGPAAGSGGAAGAAPAGGAGGAIATGGRGAAGGGGAAAGRGATAGIGAAGGGGIGVAGAAGVGPLAGTGAAAGGGGIGAAGRGSPGIVSGTGGIVTAGAAPVTGIAGTTAGAVAPGFGQAGTGIEVPRTQEDSGCQAVPRSAASEWATALACAALAFWLGSRRRAVAVAKSRRR